MTLEDKVHASRLRVLQRAEELGNVSAACREAGITRTLYYRGKKRFTLYGTDGLHPRRTPALPGRGPQLDSTKERRIVAMAKVASENNAAEAASFLRDVVAMEMKNAG